MNSFMCLFICIFIYSFVGWIINIHWVNTTWQTLTKHFSSASLIRCFYAYQSGISTPLWMAAMNENLTSDWQPLRLNRYSILMEQIDFSTCVRGSSKFPGSQYLRLWAPNTRGLGSSPSQGTKIAYGMWHGLKK